MPIVNANDYQFAFSLNKQSDMATALADGSIKYCRSARNFAPVVEAPTNITDRAWYGKGHSFSTFVDRVAKLYTVPAQERSASALETLMSAAFCMGAVQTTQPNSALEQYQHVVTLLPTTTNKEVRYTSVGEIMGSEYAKKYSGAWINSFTLTGNRMDHVVLSYEGGARKMETTTLTTLAISPTSFYKTLFGTVSFGLSGGLADISVEVISWTITISQGALPMWLMGNSAGDEMLLSKVLIGKQTVNANVVIMVNASHRQHFLDDEEVGLTLVLKSPDLTCLGGSQHSCTITMPEMKIFNEAFGLEGDTVTYTLNFGEDGLLKTGVGEAITLTFNSDIDDSELLVNG